MGCLLAPLTMRQRTPFALTCRYCAYHVSLPWGALPGESTDIFAARAERDGAWRRSVKAEFPASFAEVQHLGALSLTLGILLGPEDTEISVRHLVGSLALAQTATDCLYDNPIGPLSQCL